MDIEKGEVHTFYTFGNFGPVLNHFMDNYNLVKVVLPPDKKQPKGKPKNQRTCRFCGVKDSPQSFSDGDSHLIPKMLGNRYLISDFECFNCNQTFSVYENSFANSLGIYRALFGIKGSGKVPKFDSNGNTVRAQTVDFHGVKAVTLEETTERIKAFKLDKATGKVSIQFQKHSYIPIHIYKILFKIALSLVPEHEAESYLMAYEFLLSTLKDERVKGMCNILYFELPLTHRIDKPVCYLFKKKHLHKQIPTHYFMLRFQHLVFQFPLHYHTEDVKNGIYQTGGTDTPWCPPLLYNVPTENSCYMDIRDLSSTEKVIEDQVMSFEMDPQRLTALGAMNLETGEITDTPFNPEEIVKFILYNGNESPDFSGFKQPRSPNSADVNNS